MMNCRSYLHENRPAKKEKNMDLQEQEKSTKQITGIASFEGKFDVEISYTDKEEMQRTLEKCRKTIYIKHQAKEEIDQDKLLDELSKRIISWDGLTIGIAATIVPIDIPPGAKDTVVPCTEKNKRYLLKKAYGFDMFVQSVSTDLGALKRESERKN